MDNPQNSALEKLLDGIGGFGELAHAFYTAMINAGADKDEASAGMQGFIVAFWADAMNNARSNDP